MLAAVRPELFTFARGWVRVNTDGVTRLERHDDGPHRVVVDLDTALVAQEVLSRICRARPAQRECSDFTALVRCRPVGG